MRRASRSRSRWSHVVRACAWVATAAAVGPAGGRGVEAQQQSAPVFKSGVDLLTIDVQITPAGNAAMRELTPADFEISISGHERPVVSVTLMHYDEGTVVRSPMGQAVPGCVFGFHRKTDRGTAHYLISLGRIAADQKKVKLDRVKVLDKALAVQWYLWRSPIARSPTQSTGEQHGLGGLRWATGSRGPGPDSTG